MCCCLTGVFRGGHVLLRQRRGADTAAAQVASAAPDAWRKAATRAAHVLHAGHAAGAGARGVAGGRQGAPRRARSQGQRLQQRLYSATHG